jgi:hypothetical protein
MNNMNKKIYKIGSATLLGIALIGSSTVFALPTVTSSVNSNVSVGSSGSSSNSAMSSSVNAAANSNGKSSANSSVNASSKSNNHSTRSLQGKIKACENRQKAITKIIGDVTTRLNKQINLFSTIATRVEAFYVSKNYTLSDYNQLVANVNTTKSQALSNYAMVKSSDDFSCSVAHPKAMIDSFRSYLTTEISSLRQYKTAVRNLIVGVESAKASSTTTSNTTVKETK